MEVANNQYDFPEEQIRSLHLLVDGITRLVNRGLRWTCRGFEQHVRLLLITANPRGWKGEQGAVRW